MVFHEARSAAEPTSTWLSGLFASLHLYERPKGVETMEQCTACAQEVNVSIGDKGRRAEYFSAGSGCDIRWPLAQHLSFPVSAS